MNQAVRDKLCQMLAKYGPPLVEDPRRCEGLLRDLCPQDKREIHVLLGALRERVPAELAAPAMRRGAAAAIGRLTKRLEENLALAEVPARWAVESWALALGVVTPKQLAAAGPRKPKPPAASPVVPPPVIQPPAARSEPGSYGRAIVWASSLLVIATATAAGLAWNWPAVRDLVSRSPAVAPTPEQRAIDDSEVTPLTPQQPAIVSASVESASKTEARMTKSTATTPTEFSAEEIETVQGALDRESKSGSKGLP